MVGFYSQMESSDHAEVSQGDNDGNSVTDSKEPRDGASKNQQPGEAPSQTPVEDNGSEPEDGGKTLKGILKQRGQYCMRKVKVDFDLIPKRIPFDETKDYTVEIKIVDKEPIKIKSWAAIFAAKKAEAEAEAAALKEADEALKKAEEVRKREAEKKANKAKKSKTEGITHEEKVTHGEQDVSEEMTNLLIETTGVESQPTDEESLQQPSIDEECLEQPTIQEESPQQLCESEVQRLSVTTEESPAADAGDDSLQETNIARNKEDDAGLLGSKVGLLEEDAAVSQIVEGAEEGLTAAAEDEDIVVLAGKGILEEKKVPKSVLVKASSIIEEILEDVPSILPKAFASQDRNEPADSHEQETEGTIDAHEGVEKLLSSRDNDNYCDCSTKDGKKDSDTATTPPDEPQKPEELTSATEDPTVATEPAPPDEIEEPLDCEKFKKQRDSVFTKKVHSIREASPEILETAVSILEEIEKLSVAVVGNVIAAVP